MDEEVTTKRGKEEETEKENTPVVVSTGNFILYFSFFLKNKKITKTLLFKDNASQQTQETLQRPPNHPDSYIQLEEQENSKSDSSTNEEASNKSNSGEDSANQVPKDSQSRERETFSQRSANDSQKYSLQEQIEGKLQNTDQISWIAALELLPKAQRYLTYKELSKNLLDMFFADYIFFDLDSSMFNYENTVYQVVFTEEKDWIECTKNPIKGLGN